MEAYTPTAKNKTPSIIPRLSMMTKSFQLRDPKRMLTQIVQKRMMTITAKETTTRKTISITRRCTKDIKNSIVITRRECLIITCNSCCRESQAPITLRVKKRMI